MKIKNLIAVSLPAVALAVLTTACAYLGAKHLMDYQSESLKNEERGAVLLHVISNRSLVASRWLKVDEPDVKHTFTVFHSRKRNSNDDLSQYDLVTVAPGTYAVYALYADCPEGYRRLEVESDADDVLPETATALGVIKWNYRLKDSEYGLWPGVGLGFGLGVGHGRGWGGGSIGLGLGGYGTNFDRALTTSCALFSPGVDERGRPLIAGLTVKPGEIVYAGELTFNSLANLNCRTSGDWAHQGRMIRQCGAARLELTVKDSFKETAQPFLLKTVGAAEAQRAVARPAVPGILANTAKDVN